MMMMKTVAQTNVLERILQTSIYQSDPPYQFRITFGGPAAMFQNIV